MIDFAFALARVMLSAVFLISGYGKFITVSGVANTLAARGFPQPTAFGYAVAAVELIGGALLVLGFRARTAALVLLLFTAGTIAVSHNFWDMDGIERVRNQVQALKNLAIMGGLLLIVAAGPGRFSLSQRG